MKNRRINDLILASGAPGLLLLAFLMDTIVRAAAPLDSESPQMGNRVVLMLPLFELLVMVALVAMIWLMVGSRSYSRWVSAVYLALGLTGLYLFVLYFIALLPESMTWIMLYLTPDTFTFQASGAIAALGLISLWFWRAPEPAQASAAEPDPVENLPQ